jgi:predicted dehydrogenase
MGARTDVIRWGILGTGGIAKTFAAGLAALDDAKLVAVGSRTSESARAFALAHGGIRAHVSYEALVVDAEVDAVYVATPHPAHHANALLCIAHGKAALVE